MRTFDENLNAYHALNAQNDIYRQNMMVRIRRASTQEEIADLAQEGLEHILGQSKTYEELGKEMVEIMNKRWWQFWK